MYQQLLFYLKVSRPGLWFATLWLYILPTSQMANIWSSIPFWLGLFYVCFPLNFLVYGWNDMVDFEADKVNPRKNSFLFGAKGNQEQLKSLWKPMLIVQLSIIPFLFYFIGGQFILLILPFLLINYLYNLPENGLRSRPPFELFCQVGYLLVVPFSCWLNETSALPWQTYFYLLLFAWQSHLIGEVMDIEPDRKAGKTTTATLIGMKWTKLIIIGVVILEVALLFWVFGDPIFSGMLGLGLCWLILDLLWIYRTNTYTVQQMQLFGYLSNIVAIVSMLYVWYSGCLLQVY